MSELTLYASVLLFGVLVSAISQVILKKESQKEHDSVSKEYLNVRVIFAYAMFFGSTLLAVFAYKVVPLSMGPILEATSYIWITLFGLFIFKESITKKQYLALALIIAGIIVFSVF